MAQEQPQNINIWKKYILPISGGILACTIYYFLMSDKLFLWWQINLKQVNGTRLSQEEQDMYMVHLLDMTSFSILIFLIIRMSINKQPGYKLLDINTEIYHKLSPHQYEIDKYTNLNSLIVKPYQLIVWCCYLLLIMTIPFGIFTINHFELIDYFLLLLKAKAIIAFIFCTSLNILPFIVLIQYLVKYFSYLKKIETEAIINQNGLATRETGFLEWNQIQKFNLAREDKNSYTYNIWKIYLVDSTKGDADYTIRITPWSMNRLKAKEKIESLTDLKLEFID